jgi:hypothetical protein
MKDRTDLGPVLSTKTVPFRPEYVGFFDEGGKKAPLNIPLDAYRFFLTKAGYKASGIKQGQGVRRLTIEFDVTVSGEPMMTLVYLRARDLKEWEDREKV